MWYMNRGKDGDVALSTRVRVARNITGYPFPDNMTDDMAREVIDKVKGVFDGKDGWESMLRGDVNAGDTVKAVLRDGRIEYEKE